MGYICDNCGLVFNDNYGHGGYIDHNNEIMNIGVVIGRYDSDSWDSYKHVFLNILGIDGNLCNIVDDKNISQQKINCIILGLEKIGRKDIVDYLNSLSIEKAYLELNERYLKELNRNLIKAKGKIAYIEEKIKDRELRRNK